MSFTATHYNEVARIIRERHQANIDVQAQYPDTWNTCRNRRMELDMIKDELSRMFAADNPRFDAERFALNCEPKAGGAK